MTVGTMEILGRDGANFPTLLLDRQTRDALARYVQQRFPALARRKSIEREYDLTPDEARAVMEGNPSAATVDKIWKHPNGGWSVALPVLGAVIGHGVGDYFAAERERLLNEAAKRQQDAEQLAAVEREATAILVSFLPRARMGAGLAAVGDRVASVRRRRSAARVGSNATGGA